MWRFEHGSGARRPAYTIHPSFRRPLPRAGQPCVSLARPATAAIRRAADGWPGSASRAPLQQSATMTRTLPISTARRSDRNQRSRSAVPRTRGARKGWQRMPADRDTAHCGRTLSRSWRDHCRRGAAGCSERSCDPRRSVCPASGSCQRATAEGRWTVSDEAHALLRHWKESAGARHRAPRRYLVRESVLAGAFCSCASSATTGRFTAGLRCAAAARASGRARQLLLRDVRRARMLVLLAEQQAAVCWLARAQCDALAYALGCLCAQAQQGQPCRFTPLTAPLFCSSRWVGCRAIGRAGAAQRDPLADLTGTAGPAQALTD